MFFFLTGILMSPTETPVSDAASADLEPFENIFKRKGKRGARFETFLEPNHSVLSHFILFYLVLSCFILFFFAIDFINSFRRFSWRQELGDGRNERGV